MRCGFWTVFMVCRFFWTPQLYSHIKWHDILNSLERHQTEWRTYRFQLIWTVYRLLSQISNISWNRYEVTFSLPKLNGILSFIPRDQLWHVSLFWWNEISMQTTSGQPLFLRLSLQVWFYFLILQLYGYFQFGLWNVLVLVIKLCSFSQFWPMHFHMITFDH